MAKHLARPILESWLTRTSKLAQVVALSGLRGAGKSTLVRQWLKSSSPTGMADVKWYTIVRFLTLSSILGQKSETPIDQAFVSCMQTWRDLKPRPQFVVWDDFHLLDSNVRLQLIHFLKFQADDFQHILIADEDLSQELGLDVPHLVVPPFTLSELTEYLRLVEYSSATTPESILQTTGGLPLFVGFCLQNPGSSLNITDTIKDLDDPTKEFLEFFSIWGHPFTPTLVRELFGDDSSLQNAQRRHLLTELPDRDEKEYQVFTLVSDHFQTSKVRPALAKKLSSFLQNTRSIDAFDKFIIALRIADRELIEATIPHLSIDSFENLAGRDLTQIEKWITELLDTSNNAILMRFKLHIMILRGLRAEAVQWGSNQISSLDFDTPISSDLKWFAYEVVYWAARTGKNEISEKIISNLIHVSEEPLKSLLKVEQALPFIDTDPDRALDSLGRLRQQLEKVSESREIRLALAQTTYQMAIAMNSKGDFVRAIELYQTSQNKYQELQKYYFAAFCLFNQCWIWLTMRDFPAFEAGRKKLMTLANQKGYRYLLVGVDLLESVQNYLDGHASEALRILNAADQTAQSINAKQARIDILFEKVKVLNFLGLKSQSLKTLLEIGNIIPKDDPRLKRQDLLLNIGKIDVDEFRDRWVTLAGSEDNEDFLITLLENGIAASESQNIALEKTARGQLALRQFELTSRLQNAAREDEEQIWKSILKLDEILKKFSDPRPERIARHLVEAGLVSATTESGAKLLDLAEQELVRWGSDCEDKLFLTAHLKAQQSSQSIDTFSEWKATSLTTRNRWAAWFPERNKKLDWTMISLQGSTELEQPPDIFSKSAIVFFEDRGVVKRSNREIPDFYRKPVLRTILARIFEAYPGSISKSGLANSIWGEAYNPLVHDARIYTSIQRLRSLLGENAIEIWEGGYRWNSAREFYLLRSRNLEDSGGHKVRALVLEILKKWSKEGRPWVRRAELVEATGSSEATIKRILSQLMTEKKILRQGAGPSVKYSVAS